MHKLRRLVTVISALFGLLAVAKELAQPRGIRVGEGTVFGVPYSLRPLSPSDLKQRYWNPAGPAVVPPLFGVGFALNIPALLRRVGVWKG